MDETKFYPTSHFIFRINAKRKYYLSERQTHERASSGKVSDLQNDEICVLLLVRDQGQNLEEKVMLTNPDEH